MFQTILKHCGVRLLGGLLIYSNMSQTDYIILFYQAGFMEYLIAQAYNIELSEVNKIVTKYRNSR